MNIVGVFSANVKYTIGRMDSATHIQVGVLVSTNNLSVRY